MNKLVTALILTLLLSGCAGGAVVAGAAAGTSVLQDNRTISKQLDDKNLTYLAERALHKDELLNAQTKINVATINGLMLLTGRANSEQARQLAVERISEIEGVKRIYNRIELGRFKTLTENSRDTWITSKVKTNMLAEKGLTSGQIKVVTDNKTTYLMGLVTRDTGRIATNVAAHTPDVEKVVKLFEYTS